MVVLAKPTLAASAKVHILSAGFLALRDNENQEESSQEKKHQYKCDQAVQPPN